MGYILHVSDFHIKEDFPDKHPALKAVVNALKAENYNIDLIVHTGDMIDSKGGPIATTVQKRYAKANSILTDFAADLNVSHGNVIIACGNHDIIRRITGIECDRPPKKLNRTTEAAFQYYTEFLQDFRAANQGEQVQIIPLNGVNFLMLNSNWCPDENTVCVNCTEVIPKLASAEIAKYCTGDALNIVVAHKPIYEICETARLSFARSAQTEFMHLLRNYLGDTGIYLCGDKHTHSIVDETFHDITHFLAGQPFKDAETAGEKHTEHSIAEQPNNRINYNLLEYHDGGIGTMHKLQLSCTNGDWVCKIQPMDRTVRQLYNLSRESIMQNTFDVIGCQIKRPSWNDLYYTIETKKIQELTDWNSNLQEFYSIFTRYRPKGEKREEWGDKNRPFSRIEKRLNDAFKDPSCKNPLNIRGEYSSGKSTFLGLLYLHLLSEYSHGNISFIPAYFNVEICEDIKLLHDEDHGSVHSAARRRFSHFTASVQKIAAQQKQNVCYIIDGLDEQDCWSDNLDTSIASQLLEIVKKYDSAWYIASYSQHKLPGFKRSIEPLQYGDNSDVMYFNSIMVAQQNTKGTELRRFVKCFSALKLNGNPPAVDPATLESYCLTIDDFARPAIDVGFMFHHFAFLRNKENTTHGTQYYQNYKFEQVCNEELGDQYKSYVPAIAYRFSYCGWTYEKLKKEIGKGNKPVYVENTISLTDEVLFTAFNFVRKHSDTRNYLTALHYYEELKWYALHPELPVPDDSVLNIFVTRDFGYGLRKLMRDGNAFMILFDLVLDRKNLFSYNVYSFMLYLLAFADITEQERERRKWKFYTRFKVEKPNWKYKPDASEADSKPECQEKNEQFFGFGLQKTMETFQEMDATDSTAFAKKLDADPDFSKFNCQYQMLYYGDLALTGSIYRNELHPFAYEIDKKYDFYKTYYYLSSKLQKRAEYPLRDYDLYTLCKLAEYCSDIKDKDERIDFLISELATKEGTPWTGIKASLAGNKTQPDSQQSTAEQTLTEQSSSPQQPVAAQTTDEQPDAEQSTEEARKTIGTLIRKFISRFKK